MKVGRSGQIASNATRAFATSSCCRKELAVDTSTIPNMRHAQRDTIGKLEAPIVNPAGRIRGSIATGTDAAANVSV